MCITYRYNKEGVELSYCAWIRGYLWYNPSECCMLIPGTYAQMMDDYG
jgi:hypothetical protein